MFGALPLLQIRASFWPDVLGSVFNSPFLVSVRWTRQRFYVPVGDSKMQTTWNLTECDRAGQRGSSKCLSAEQRNHLSLWGASCFCLLGCRRNARQLCGIRCRPWIASPGFGSCHVLPSQPSQVQAQLALIYILGCWRYL